VVCRETEIADSGDFYAHDIASWSVVVTRAEDGAIHGFMNACLHRGRQLKSGHGNSRELRCPFHGFSWQLDGAFKNAPCAWDFEHIDKDNFDLDRIQVAIWGGWVFINMDPEAASLRATMGVMPDHFERWQPENTYKAFHLKKVLRCNWKSAHEAFIESFHTVATHPQLLAYTADANSQYDCFNDHVSRTITPMGMISPHVEITEQECAQQWMLHTAGLSEEELLQLPEGMDARHFLADYNRQRFAPLFERDLATDATDSEMLDAILYSVFPNFAPWGGFRPNLTYRFLPWQDDHEMCTMEIIMMMQYPPGEQRPRDAEPRLFGADEMFTGAEGISAGLGRVFDQDFSNLPRLHLGLKSLRSGQVQLGNYQEIRIRHFHQTLDQYLEAES
jgi:phenylpropionate dioxygenase-like ring-hydroxylating dioxygenase large terminal subunit